MQRIVDEIKRIIQDVSGISAENIESDCNLFSFGLDSLMLVQIKKKVDRKFQLELPLGRIMSDLDTIEKIAHFINGDVEQNQSEILEERVEAFHSLEAVEVQDHIDEKVLSGEDTAKEKENVQNLQKKKEKVVSTNNIKTDVEISKIQEIFEMQMRVMAESMQNLAMKQLEVVAPKQKEKAKEKAKEKENVPQINFRAVKFERDIFTEEQKHFIQSFIKRYNQKTRSSKEYAKVNRKQFCDWITTLNFRMDFKELIYPIVSSRSQGAKFWDLDGNQYLDMAIGYGVHYFGHRPQFIVDALQEQMAEGYETGPQTDLGGEVAKLICEITGSERVAFANTGSEAVMAALRIARTVTKKSKIVMFRGAYHGNFDCVLADSDEGVTFPTSPGTMAGMVEDVIVLEYGKEAALQEIETRADEIAAVIVEPVQSRNPSLQPKEFLHSLRKLTEKRNIAFIFDEMITGFRICPGGCQEYFGIQADMVTYGKIIGGGMPIGVVAGKATYLDAVDGGYWNYGDASYPEHEMTYFAGTFCKHPLSLAASRAVLRFIAQDKGEVQKKVNALTAEFVKQVNAYFLEDSVPLKVSYFGSEFRFESFGKYDLSRLPAEIELFFYLLMEKGIYIWEKRTCFFSVAHTYEDARFFLDAIKSTVEEMRNGGFIFSVERSADEKKNDIAKKMKQDFTVCNPTKAQERYFLLSQMEHSESGAHLPSAVVITGQFSTDKVQTIFQQIIQEQQLLRCCYGEKDGELVLKIYDMVEGNVEFVEGNGKSIEEHIQEFLQPFHLFQPPLMHIRVVKLEEQKHLLLFDIHHSIADGYACTLIIKRFMNLYVGNKEWGEVLPYEQFIKNQELYKATDSYREDVEYWKEHLGEDDLSVAFPMDFIRPDNNDTSGATLADILEHELLVKLKQVAKEKKCSLYHLLYGAFSILIYKMSAKETFVVGTPVELREDGLYNTVGNFTNIMVLKSQIKEEWSLPNYLQKVRYRLGENMMHAKVPFADLVALTATNLRRNRNPMFDMMFIYENGEERVNRIADIVCEAYEIPNIQSFFDLSFELIEEYERLSIHITYKTALYKQETIKQILMYYKQLLQEIILFPEETISYFLSSYQDEFIKRRQQSRRIEEQIQKNTYQMETKTFATNGNTKGNTELEEELLSYWKTCLHTEQVGIYENFFDMGGRSIDALNLIDMLKHKYRVTIMDLFRYPTIAQLAKKLSNEQDELAKDSSQKQSIEKKERIENKQKSMEAEDQETGLQMPIAIIGMAGKFPKSKNVTEFWKNLVEGKECIHFFEKEELLQEGISEEELENPQYVMAKGILEDAECFDAAFFEYSPKEAEKMDPQIRIFHECVWNALEDAGYTPDSITAGFQQPQKIGVFAGSASNYTWMSHIYEPTSDVQERMERISLNDKDYMATRVSYKMNLTGPSYGVQTACSSSLTSIHLACRSLQLGECEMALAGGVSIMLPQKTGYQYKDGLMLSQDGHCRVFDEKATGTVFSDGVGIIVLKPLKQAIKDNDNIYAVIRGTAVNNDGNQKAGYTAPSMEGQAEVIMDAIHQANIQASSVTFVEAHGTGTVLGDPIEVEGLKEVYPTLATPYCALGSLKSNFGHLDAAAGVAGVMKVALALKHGVIPANINCDTPNPNLQLEESPFFIPTKTIPWEKKKNEPRRAGVTSLGFGGTNAHVVLEEFELNIAQEEVTMPQQKKLFLFSARTKVALEQMKQQYIQYLGEHPDVHMDSMAYTLQVGRKAFPYRQMVLASNCEELLAGLTGAKKAIPTRFHMVEKDKAQVVFLFTGQGSQYLNMARDLYEKEKGFAKYMDQCFKIVAPRYDGDVDYQKIVFPACEGEENAKLLRETGNAQIILFILEYSMARYLMELGIIPDALIGHSLGEYVAACIAGVFSLEDGLRLVLQRARLMQSVECGGMDALCSSEEEVLKLIEESKVQLSIAAKNGPENCVVSGTFEELQRFERFLDEKKMDYRRLETSHAFHSVMMDSILESFQSLLCTITMSSPQIPYISNLTGGWVTNEVQTPEYWCKHLRNTVRFYEGIQTILKKKSIFIEVGPGKVLSSLVRNSGQTKHIKAIYNTIRHPRENIDDVEYFLQRIGEIWCSGIYIDFRVLYGERQVSKLHLPGYLFQGQSYKIQEMERTKKKERPMSEWLYRPCWKVRKRSIKEYNPNTLFVLFGVQNTLLELIQKKLIGNGNQVVVITELENLEGLLKANVADKNRLISVINLVPYFFPTIETCFWELMKQIQSFGMIPNIHYYVITKEQREMNELVYSLVNGVCAVASKEYENLNCTEIVMSQDESDEQLADKIFMECKTEQTGSYIKYENGLRLELDEEPFAYEKNQISRINQNGAYVITGGLGDIGRYLADYLTNQYNAKVLLLSRDSLPKEETWESLCKENANAYVVQKIKSILKWRKEQVHIEIKYCDICNVEEVEHAIAEFEEENGTIQGVFHIAGIKGDGLIRFKTRENAMEVLKPKVQGTQVMEQVFSNRNLDFMVLFSSLATRTEDAGQADYVAANRYLDAYATWATQQYPNRKTISICWDNWKNIGMAHRAGLKKPSQKAFFESALLPSQGMKILECALSSEETQVIVSVLSLRKRKQDVSKDNCEQFIKDVLQEDRKYERPELSTEYVESYTDIQRRIASVWETAFSLKTVGIQDDFFELGGDSLYAIGIVNELKKYYQIDMTDIYEYPTIEQLARKLESCSFDLVQQIKCAKETLRALEDRVTREKELRGEKERYYALYQDYKSLELTSTKDWEQILLLGGTGYLGIYLLKEIVMQTNAKVVLIVRPNEKVDGKTRIYEKFCSYFGEEMYQRYQDRWLVLDGDISKKKFGLDDTKYGELAESVECIVNASGKVDHYGEYEAFYKANVEVVKHLIAFAKVGCEKEIHHMSTKGVGTGKIAGRKSILFTEFEMDFGQEFSNYYVDTKHQAEKLLGELQKEGDNVNLYRIGDIVYDSTNGHFQENIEKNAVYLMMQSILELDYLPKDLPAFMEFTCVDFVSKAIVSFMKQKQLSKETYHLLNPNLLSFADLEPVLKKEGYSITYVERDTFFQYLVDYYDNPEKKEWIQNFLTYSHFLELPMYTEFEIVSDKTCSLLEKMDLHWKKPDVESLSKMIEYGQKIHFFKENRQQE